MWFEIKTSAEMTPQKLDDTKTKTVAASQQQQQQQCKQERCSIPNKTEYVCKKCHCQVTKLAISKIVFH